MPRFTAVLASLLLCAVAVSGGCNKVKQAKVEEAKDLVISHLAQAKTEEEKECIMRAAGLGAEGPSSGLEAVRLLGSGTLAEGTLAGQKAATLSRSREGTITASFQDRLEGWLQAAGLKTPDDRELRNAAQDWLQQTNTQLHDCLHH